MLHSSVLEAEILAILLQLMQYFSQCNSLKDNVVVGEDTDLVVLLFFHGDITR